MKLELQQLVARHGQDIAQVKSACDRQIETYKRLAQEASQEWHEVEGELAGEKTQVLHTLQELKEFKLRYFQLEEDTTERIAELVQDERDRERERDAAMSRVTALEKELKAIHAKVLQLLLIACLLDPSFVLTVVCLASIADGGGRIPTRKASRPDRHRVRA